ncbi:MAG: NAD-dependent epimerase/dehydratase family protein [Erysipelothrix sp.]|nr:NAD-dependent epimerase/dehydratase family protein [Erysipelothrix sp.]
MKKILITGAFGQIGSELKDYLRSIYGVSQVISSNYEMMVDNGPFELIDVTNYHQIEAAVIKHQVDTIIHLAALLSAVGEETPTLAWKINMDGLFNVLEVARKYKCQVFHPSSIGAFGPSTTKNNVPQVTIQRPTTIYGVSKVSGELLCDYYVKRFNVDVRGVRFPGLISYQMLPGGGTTDYAVDIFYEALKHQSYTCYLSEDTQLDMMYMPDALKAIVDLMEAPFDKLHHHNAYNVSAMSITPKELAQAIQEILPDFTIRYDIDPVRQSIADSWPNSIDSSDAKKDWNFEPHYDLQAMTKDMLEKLRKKGIQ